MKAAVITTNAIKGRLGGRRAGVTDRGPDRRSVLHRANSAADLASGSWAEGPGLTAALVNDAARFTVHRAQNARRAMLSVIPTSPTGHN